MSDTPFEKIEGRKRSPTTRRRRTRDSDRPHGPEALASVVAVFLLLLFGVGVALLGVGSADLFGDFWAIRG